MTRYATFLFFIFFAENEVACGQNTVPEERVAWDCIIVGYRPNNNYPGHGAYDIKLQKLSYVLDGVVVWTREAPERVKKLTGVYVTGTESKYKNGDMIREAGIETDLYLIDFYVCDNVFLQNTIAISSKAGFLLYDKREGRLLIDQPYPVAEENPNGYFTPETDIIIKVKRLSCGLTSRCRRGEFTGECGDYLFHYNGHTLFVFDNKCERINTQKGKIKLTADRKFTTFSHRKYKVLQEARKRNLEK
jgi:hypothetical protein